MLQNGEEMAVCNKPIDFIVCIRTKKEKLSESFHKWLLEILQILF